MTDIIAPEEDQSTRFYGLMILTTLFWGGAFPAGKIVSGLLEPATASFIRFLIALPFFLLLLKVFGENMSISREGHRNAAIFGLLQITAYNFLFFLGLKFTTSSNATIIIASGPALTALIAWFVLPDEKMRPTKILGIVLAFVGVSVIVISGSNNIEGNIFGNLIIFGAAITFAIYTIFARKALKMLTPLQLTFWGTFYGVLALGFIALTETHPTRLDPSLIWPMLYLSLFAGVFSFLFYNIGTQKIGASKAAIFINLVPVFGVLTSVIILGEKFYLWYLIPFLCIISGVYLVNKK